MEKGADSPEFKSQEQAQHIIGLLMRHMNDVAQTLNQAPEQYEPLLMENPNDGDPISIMDEWCVGFMKGVELELAAALRAAIFCRITMQKRIVTTIFIILFDNAPLLG
jgi:yecA family protein